jgi:hypothetical protein
MSNAIASVTLVAFLSGGAPFAQIPAVYTWTGYGINPPGSSKCPT